MTKIRNMSQLPVCKCSIFYISVPEYNVRFQISWNKKCRKTSEPYKKTGLVRVFCSSTDHKKLHPCFYLFPSLSTKAIVKFVIFTPPGNIKLRTEEPCALIFLTRSLASLRISDPVRKEGFMMSDWNAPKMEPSTTDIWRTFLSCRLSIAANQKRVVVVSEKPWAKRGLKIWIWPQISQWTEKINIMEAKQRLQETHLSFCATIRCVLSAIDLSSFTQHRNMKTIEIRMLSRNLKPVLASKVGKTDWGGCWKRFSEKAWPDSFWNF